MATEPLTPPPTTPPLDTGTRPSLGLTERYGRSTTPRVPRPARPERQSRDGSPRPARSRAGAVWVGIAVATLVMVALIVFMMQNTQRVLVTFLGMEGTIPLALALLIAGAGVGLVVLVVGTIRIQQLRKRR